LTTDTPVVIVVLIYTFVVTLRTIGHQEVYYALKIVQLEVIIKYRNPIEDMY